jgi:spoIIIJ-associated protein
MAQTADSRAPADILRELLERIVAGFALSATVDVDDDGETVTGTLHGDDLGLFIGRHGQTIDAVQHLAVRVIQNTDEGRERRVVVDAEGYRKRRAEILCRQADEAAEQAVKYSRPVALDAMTAGERRLVHEYLRDRGDVETYSEGEEPDRHLIVAPLK